MRANIKLFCLSIESDRIYEVGSRKAGVEGMDVERNTLLEAQSLKGLPLRGTKQA